MNTKANNFAILVFVTAMALVLVSEISAQAEASRKMSDCIEVGLKEALNESGRSAPRVREIDLEMFNGCGDQIALDSSPIFYIRRIDLPDAPKNHYYALGEWPELLQTDEVTMLVAGGRTCLSIDLLAMKWGLSVSAFVPSQTFESITSLGEYEFWVVFTVSLEGKRRDVTSSRIVFELK